MADSIIWQVLGEYHHFARQQKYLSFLDSFLNPTNLIPFAGTQNGELSYEFYTPIEKNAKKTL